MTSATFGLHSGLPPAKTDETLFFLDPILVSVVGLPSRPLALVRRKAMEEIGWLRCSRPKLMLGFLRGKTSVRKLRWFKVACCRSAWHLITDDRLRKIV